MEETNPYLALRAEKIARNQRRLAELGLLPQKVTPETAQKSKKSNVRKKRRATVTEVKMVLRRSPRNAHSAQEYKDPMVSPRIKRKKVKEPSEHQQGGVLAQATTQARNHSAEKEAAVDDSIHDGGVLVQATTPVRNYPAHAARAINIHVDNLVIGGLLGERMEEPGKAFVMKEAVRRCSSAMSLSTTHRDISFNKYCGVQQWRNDAIFLWVNLDCGVLVNDFMNGGRQISWFGGSRMHDDSDVILRLLRVGKSAARGDLPASDGIVLWCRSVDTATRGYTPYVCLGRLSYHSHEPGTRPLKFIWNLEDYDRLINSEDKGVRKMFKELVSL